MYLDQLEGFQVPELRQLPARVHERHPRPELLEIDGVCPVHPVRPDLKSVQTLEMEQSGP